MTSTGLTGVGEAALDPLQAIAAPVEVKASLTDSQINQLLVDLGLIEPPAADKPALRSRALPSRVSAPRQPAHSVTEGQDGGPW